jgi:hypothetical protein
LIRSFADEEFRRAELEKERVYVFDSYLEAAVIAYNRHLISSEGLLKVQASCIEGLYSSKIKFKSEEQQRARMKELERASSNVGLFLRRESLAQH